MLLVRHAESSVHLGEERTRGLTAQGLEDVRRLTAGLRQTHIDAVISSPYARAVLTVQGIADDRGLPVLAVEEWRERRLHGEDVSLPKEAFLAAIGRSFADPDEALPGGESLREAQARGLLALRELLREYRGGTIAVGTHGNLMVMLLRAFDARYDYAFWQRLSMPDVYRLTFGEDKLMGVERQWN